jgi:monoterpene epsilon-lactone hydrolase
VHARHSPHRCLGLLASFALLATAFSTVAFAATSIPAPDNLSAEAQAYLNKARVGAIDGGGMAADPQRLERMRKALGNMFLSFAKQIDPNLYLTRQNLGSVDGFWINSAAPTRPGPVIIYLHGGGRILGSAETNLGSAIRITQAAGIPVLSIQYRLAPEHPFPADLEDALAAYRWLLDNGYTASQIGIYGDSAGGNLSLALALAARMEGLPAPGAVAVLSPSVDYTDAGDTRITLRDVDPVLRTASSASHDAYVGAADIRNPLISPIFGDYTEFPPLLIQVGTREILLSDSIRLARRARAAGTDVTLDVWDGMWHGWHDNPKVPEAEQACREIADFFQRQLMDR